MTRILVAVLLAGLNISWAQQDTKGSSDHPLFPNRMPGYSISVYQQQAFSSYAFRTKPPTPVEGRYTRINYYLREPKEHPGGLAILRNYENAIKSIGGQVVLSTDSFRVMKAVHNGREVWAEVQSPTSYQARTYILHVVEREAMAQVITAEAMGAELDKAGFVALDIHFATGKADILPESMPIVNEIVSLLKKRPTLRVDVEGHTDITGTPAGNRTLSAARAKSVVAAITAGGIGGNRLFPAGYGQDKPVADNNTEEGRAKNRRVVIRKRP